MKHKKAITIPPIISVKKCAPTTTLLKETTKAKTKKKYFILGMIVEQTRAKIKIVEVWPEGNEWKLELKVKKSKFSKPSKIVWLGLALPTICFNNCVKKPVKDKHVIV